MGSLDQDTDIADIISFEVVDGEIRAKIGDALLDEGIDQDVGIWGVSGFYSAPDAPIPGIGAPQCLYFYDGNQKRIIATRDNRHAQFVGEMKEGDRVIVSGTSRIFMKKEEKQIAMFVEGDQSMVINMDGANDQIIMINGGSWLEITPDRVQIGADGGASSITIDKKGISITGDKFAALTGSGILGAKALPADFVALTSAPGPVSPSWICSKA